MMCPLSKVVVMPNATVPVKMERDKFMQHIKTNDEIVVLTRRTRDSDEPSLANMYSVGTLVRIGYDNNIPTTGRKIICEGIKRFAVTSISLEASGPTVTGYFLETKITSSHAVEASKRAITSTIQQLLQASILKGPVYEEILALENAEHLLDMIVNQLQSMLLPAKQTFLETESLEERYEQVLTHLKNELAISALNKKLGTRIQDNVNKRQKEYFDQLKNEAIRAEFGEDNELDILAKRIHTTKMSKEAKIKSESELKKLRNMNAMSSEAVVIRHYLEWLCDLPWNKRDALEDDLSLAEKSLNETHFGLSRIKDEISKHIAVYSRTKGAHGTVLCLVGPPGVGKTSLGKSIAAATKRKFARIALGGVKDEAEIRGHRRTYVGSLPGKILQEIKRCGSINPLFMLDEIDKIGQDWRGDPASGLLEVLDPEQNGTFVDHYLEVSFPLNECMFVCTANDINKIPAALLDRMDVIQLSSYTQEEKIEIAKKYLIKKQISQNGLLESELSISDGALRTLVQNYTRESGVRELDRKIKSLASQAVLLIDTKKKNSLSLTVKNLKEYAGTPLYSSREGSSLDQIGITNGMAWSEVGGSLLTIEAVQVPGTGKVVSTGRLGKVMEESVAIAFSFLRSMAEKRGIDLSQLNTHDLHVHVPEGATPKDGPSAGVAIFLSMISSLLKLPISNTIAVTGEISLTGQVWAIGGLKEKILAAHRAGIKTVLIPTSNKPHIEDIPLAVRAAIKIIYMDHADDALEHALIGYESQFSSKNATSKSKTMGADGLKEHKGPKSED
jgi:ATP-dependent Lon protease